MKQITLNNLQQMKAQGEKITMLTAYDATFAYLLSNNGVEVLLVGDSLGMVIQGQASTLPVKVDDMAYHTACVARGNCGSMIMADLPFLSYATLEQTLAASYKVMQAGAHIIKIEGGASLASSVQVLAQNGVPTCVHMGLTPQAVNVFGGYKVQGKEEAQASKMLEDAKYLAENGAAMLLLECVPQTLAAEISQSVKIPVIGIGAGVNVDGQVLVLHDMLGLDLGQKRAKFVRNFMQGANSLADAVQNYVSAVKKQEFPTPEHSYT